MSRNLGELEQLVLLALVRLGDDAYGVPVQAEIEQRTGRSASFATVYTTLARLEAKGFVTSYTGAPTPERGGRGKKHFSVTAAGRAALSRSMRDITSMARGLGEPWSAP